jgi:2-polyprenyl-3-methyl-5-hydroxy-6-metoxy-1,4-benzoquinol methylase
LLTTLVLISAFVGELLMVTKAEIKRVAKRVTPAPIWSFARRLRAGVIEPHQLPENLLRNHRVLSPDKVLSVENSIRTHYHKGWRAEDKYLASACQKDLEDHLHNRIRDDRQRIIPWLDHVQALKGSRILEIGCGTGSSTVALSEQGAVVTGIDVDEDALVVAKDRCRAYGVDATLKTMSGGQISSNFSPSTFDFIIFFACLEHMTIVERLESLRQAWDILPSGGMMAIVETPNRLWFRDDHTAMLPFFHWLPNELAFAYSRFSNRNNFRELYRDYAPGSKQHFLRRGRGMSFHEIDLAIAPVSQLQIVSSLSEFGKSARYVTGDGREYKSTLCRLFPDIHHSFFDEYLDLVVRKI